MDITRRELKTIQELQQQPYYDSCSKQKTVMQIPRPKGTEEEPVNSSEERVNPMIIADIEGLKFDLLILQKKVEIETGFLSRLIAKAKMILLHK